MSEERHQIDVVLEMESVFAKAWEQAERYGACLKYLNGRFTGRLLGTFKEEVRGLREDFPGASRGNKNITYETLANVATAEHDEWLEKMGKTVPWEIKYMEAIRAVRRWDCISEYIREAAGS